LTLTDSTTLKGGFGLYSQPPVYHEALAPIGNPNVDAYHSLHTSLGVEQQVTEGLSVDVEGFHKYLYDRVVNTPNGEPPMFINDGVGRIFGVELGATYRSNDGLTAQLSYTLSNSERRDRDEKWRRFDQDQPHILNVAGTYELGAGWEVGTRFRYVSGNPNTPIEGAAYDANADVYLPLYGALNSSRDPAFHQLDVRGQKTFRIGQGSLAIYLDVQNVYNASNPRGFNYSYDYQKREPAASSFIFPNLGIRGQL
jgi:outer membrane receptor for ferrienterochelin and colicin